MNTYRIIGDTWRKNSEYFYVKAKDSASACDIIARRTGATIKAVDKLSKRVDPKFLIKDVDGQNWCEIVDSYTHTPKGE